jgi:methyl-accepting chemotaxis protein
MKNLKIGTRLSIGFAIVLLMLVAITVIGLWRLDDIADTTQDMVDQPIATERLISDWYANVQGSVRRTTAIAKSNDPSLVTFFADETAESAKLSTELQSKIEPLMDLPEEKALFAQIGQARKTFVTARETIAKLKAAGKTDEVNQVFDTTFLPSAKEYSASMRQLVALQRGESDKQALSVHAIKLSSRTMLIAIGVAALLFGIACAWWLTVGITKPLSKAVFAARKVAEGDLTYQIEVSSTDETGQLLQSLKEMTTNLAGIVAEVRNGTDTIGTASSQIAAGNMDLSGRTELQASSLEETASSMEELTATVKQNTENALQANQMAASASAIASQGGEMVAKVVNTMSSINDSSKKIVDIISVIDGIAFQTNILALNAAVEAARAGEQGRGFAVVASEVRNLAQRSAAAAKEIKTLIGDSVDKVDAGTRLVDQAGTTMGEIVTSVKRVADIMAEITAASREQSAGIEQVNQAVGQMDQVTQQNAALVEEAAAAAQSLLDQARSLSETVSVFKITDSSTSMLAISAA